MSMADGKFRWRRGGLKPVKPPPGSPPHCIVSDEEVFLEKCDHIL